MPTPERPTLNQIYPEKVLRSSEHRIKVTLSDGSTLSFAQGWVSIWIGILEAAWDKPVGTEVSQADALRHYYESRQSVSDEAAVYLRTGGEDAHS
jgi:hypothetical protein